MENKQLTTKNYLQWHIIELRKVAATLRGRGSKFQLQRATELEQRADEAEVAMILKKRYSK